MGITCRRPTGKVRCVLWAVTLVILSVSFVSSISGEAVGQSTKPSNGLIAFADAPGQQPGAAGNAIRSDLHDRARWRKQKAADDG